MTMPVFPCSPADKRPLTRHGFKDATTDLAVIRMWERRWPEALWGTPIPAGVFVVDVDPRHGGDGTLTVLEGENGDLPATRTTRTRSGGRHFWFTTDQPVRQDQSGKYLGQGIDTRVSGRGYVIVPPSEGYTWLDERPPVPAPQWLVKRLMVTPADAEQRTGGIPAPKVRTSRYVEAALQAECQLVSLCPIGAGVRNQTLHRAACRLGQLVGAGLLDDWRAAQALLNATSLPEREAKATILSGLNWGISNPRQVAS